VSSKLTSLSPQIDRYILHELYELDQIAREAYNTYTFSRGEPVSLLLPSRRPLTSLPFAVYQALATFSNTTLSSFYFDVIKDSLYADAKTSPERRRVVYTLQKVRYWFLPPSARRGAELTYMLNRSSKAILPSSLPWLPFSPRRFTTSLKEQAPTPRSTSSRLAPSSRGSGKHR
jgi:hypothetical protein